MTTYSRFFGAGAETLASLSRNLSPAAAADLSAALALAAHDDLEGSGVSPRVVTALVAALPTGSPLGIRTLAGLLRASRLAGPDDDRAVPFLSMVARLSTWQLLTADLFYASLRATFRGSAFSLALGDRPRLALFLPWSALLDALAPSEADREEPSRVLGPTLFGLMQENLIDPPFLYGPKETLRSRFARASDYGVILVPSGLGASLFLMGRGLPFVGPGAFFDEAVSGLDDGFQLPPGVSPVIGSEEH